MKTMILLAMLVSLNASATTRESMCNGIRFETVDNLSNPPKIAQYDKIFDKYCAHAISKSNIKHTKKLIKELKEIVVSGAYLNEMGWQSNNALFYSDCCDH